MSPVLLTSQGIDLLFFFKGVIHSIHFHRLILDEAHSIKVRLASFRPTAVD